MLHFLRKRSAPPVDLTGLDECLSSEVLRSIQITRRYRKLRSGMLEYPETLLALTLPDAITECMQSPNSIRQVISGLQDKLDEIEDMEFRP